jgi:hypothetical protein
MEGHLNERRRSVGGPALTTCWPDVLPKAWNIQARGALATAREALIEAVKVGDVPPDHIQVTDSE